MTTATIERRLRYSAAAIVVGLLVELLSLAWHSPSSFIVFVGIGGLAMAAGMLLFLFTIVKQGV